MKSTFFKIILAAVFALCGLAGAQTFPYSNPGYVPNAVGPTTSYSAPAMYTFITNGIGVASVRVTGTCTSLAATAQATNDGTNWTAVNLYPIATGTTAPVAVASISAVGFWKINTQGYSQIRLNISALTAACIVTMVGSPQLFNGTTF